MTKDGMLLGPAGEIMTLHQSERWLNLDCGQVLCSLYTLHGVDGFSVLFSDQEWLSLYVYMTHLGF